MTYHSGINRSPYKAMFGCDAKIGLSTSFLPHGLLCSLESEEDLVERLNRAEEEGTHLDYKHIFYISVTPFNTSL
jgi:hypothetical protein